MKVTLGEVLWIREALTSTSAARVPFLGTFKAFGFGFEGLHVP